MTGPHCGARAAQTTGEIAGPTAAALVAGASADAEAGVPLGYAAHLTVLDLSVVSFSLRWSRCQVIS